MQERRREQSRGGGEGTERALAPQRVSKVSSKGSTTPSTRRFSWAGDLGQPVKALATKSDDLSSILRAHTMKGEN